MKLFNSNILYVLAFIIIIASCAKDNNPANNEPDPGPNPSSTFSDTLNMICKTNSNCLAKFDDEYILINSRVQPIDVNLNKITFFHEYNNIYSFKGFYDQRYIFELSPSDCSQINVRNLSDGSLYRQIEIKSFSKEMIVMKDNVLCPEGDCYYLNKNLFSKFINYNCKNLNCSNCTKGYCNCDEYSSGNSCSNKFYSIEKYNWDKIYDVIELQIDKYLIIHTNWSTQDKWSLTQVNSEFKVLNQFNLPDQSFFQTPSIEKLDDENILLIDYNGIASKTFNYAIYNLRTNTLSSKETINYNLNGSQAFSKSKLYRINNDYLLHLYLNGFNNNLIFKLKFINGKIQIEKQLLLNANNLVVLNNEIHVLKFVQNSNSSPTNQYRNLAVSTYNSNLSLISNKTIDVIPNPNPDKSQLINITNIHEIKKTNDGYVLLIGGTISDLFLDGMDANKALLYLNNDFNFKSLNKIIGNIASGIFPYGTNFDITVNNNDVIIASSGDDGERLNISSFSSNKYYHNYTYYSEFSTKKCRPLGIFKTNDNSYMVIGDGYNYGNRLTAYKFTPNSLYDYKICD